MTPELLNTVVRLSNKYPSLRLCQLIGNAVPSEEAQRRNNDLYYVKDEQLLEWLLNFEKLADQQREVERKGVGNAR